MTTYVIAYSGWTQVTVEAASAEEAQAKFWNNGLNNLYDAEIGDIVEAR